MKTPRQRSPEATPRPRTRTCVATGEAVAETALVRFGLGPDGVLVPDAAAKLPGRGAWTRADRATVERARTRGAFRRALKAEVRAPEDLADLTEQALAQRCLAGLGLMRRAGALALGFEQVESALRSGRAAILIEAADGAADGRERLLKAAAGSPHPPSIVVGCFTAAELGMALGRDRVIHVAALQERMALRWAVDINRLAGFRAIVPDSWPWRTSSPWTGELARSDAATVRTAGASDNSDLD